MSDGQLTGYGHILKNKSVGLLYSKVKDLLNYMVKKQKNLSILKKNQNSFVFKQFSVYLKLLIRLKLDDNDKELDKSFYRRFKLITEKMLKQSLIIPGFNHIKFSNSPLRNSRYFLDKMSNTPIALYKLLSYPDAKLIQPRKYKLLFHGLLSRCKSKLIHETTKFNSFGRINKKSETLIKGVNLLISSKVSNNVLKKNNKASFLSLFGLYFKKQIDTPTPILNNKIRKNVLSVRVAFKRHINNPYLAGSRFIKKTQYIGNYASKKTKSLIQLSFNSQLFKTTRLKTLVYLSETHGFSQHPSFFPFSKKYNTKTYLVKKLKTKLRVSRQVKLKKIHNRLYKPIQRKMPLKARKLKKTRNFMRTFRGRYKKLRNDASRLYNKKIKRLYRKK